MVLGELQGTWTKSLDLFLFANPNMQPEDYSLWRVDYKYNDELTLTFMSSNLIGESLEPYHLGSEE
jgi:hypothetical protein